MTTAASSASVQSTDALEVQPWELWALAGLVGFTLLGTLFEPPGEGLEANFIGPLWLALVLFGGAMAAVYRQPHALWTGLVWMRLSTAVYFGIGSVVDRVMNETTLGELQDFFAATSAEVASFNLLAAVCSLVILSTVALAAQMWPPARLEACPSNDRLMLAAGIGFGLLGFATKYLVVFPNAMGLFGDDVVLPGALTQLVWLAPVSTFLLCYWIFRNRPGWIAIAVLLVLLDGFAGVLRFSKGEALLPLLMLAFAFLQHRLTLLRAAVAVGLAVAAFFVLQTVSSTGRAELGERYGTIRSASFGERLEILFETIVQGPPERHSELQGALIRIAYVHAAAPAMAFYDAGQPGDSLSYVPLVLIPRLLWADKPIFNMGTEYTALLTGSDTSSTWMGYFAESYWNLGWLGVPAVMMPLGLVFFGTGRYARWVLSTGQWLHFPAVFLGMYTGARTDGLIAGDVVASTLTILLVFPLASLATPVARDLLGAAAATRVFKRAVP